MTLHSFRPVLAAKPALAGFAFLVVPSIAASLLTGCTGSGGGTPQVGARATFQETALPANTPIATNIPAEDDAVDLPGPWPDDITFDSNGNVWMALHHSNEVAYFTPLLGTLQPNLIAIPNIDPNTGAISSTSMEMDSIAVDNLHNRVWVSATLGNKIIRIDLVPGGAPVVTSINAAIGNVNPIPGDVKVNPNDTSGKLWFTMPYADEINTGPDALGMVDPATNKITTFPIAAVGGLDGITFDKNGDIWFVALGANEIGHFFVQTATSILYSVPPPTGVITTNIVPTNIAVDPQGFVWVSEQGNGANALARLNPAITGGSGWTVYPIPTVNAGASGVAVDPAGNVWFTEFVSNKIGVLPAGTSTVLDFPIPTKGPLGSSGPEDIQATSNGQIFFSEQYGDKLGQISVSTIATLPVATRKKG